MEKKFEKKTRRRLYDSCWQAEYHEGVLLDYVDSANTEIDRLNDELAALRSQQSGEWSNTKGNEHTTLERDCVYLFACKAKDGSEFYSTDIPAGSVSVGLVLHARPTCYKYKCLARLSDLETQPEPKPLEVKVGKYQLKSNAIEIVSIREQGGRVWCTWFYDNKRHVPYCWDVIPMKGWLADHNARFIGEGDNQ